MGNNKIKRIIGWVGLSVFLIADIIAAPRQGDETTPPGWVLNEQEYFARPGVDVLVFHDIYPEGKQGGIEADPARRADRGRGRRAPGRHAGPVGLAAQNDPALGGPQRPQRHGGHAF